MRGPKIGLVGLPFHLWRAMLTPEMSAEGIDRLKAVHEAIDRQIGLQAFHSNCGLPTYSLQTEDSRHSSLVCTCDCGEELVRVMGIPSQYFERVGPVGVYMPAKDFNA